MAKRNPDPFIIEHTPSHLHVVLSSPCKILSSAVLNGGWTQAEHIVNLKVEKNIDGSAGPFEPSELTLKKYCRSNGWTGKVVGMMTAAGMDSFRVARRFERGVGVVALVTAGISNARRAGDPADCLEIETGSREAGTINIILLTDAILADAAMVEAVQMVTEAKSAALENLDVRNPATGSRATGTGTDAVAVVSGSGSVEVSYCGKHMLFGEMIASAVIHAVTSSLKRKRDPL